MQMEWVILGQIAAFLAVSAGTLFAISAPRCEEVIMGRRHVYVDRMGR